MKTIKNNGKTETSCKFAVEMENNQEMRKIPQIDESQLGTNPYLYELQIPVTEIVKDIDYEKTEEGVLINKVLYAERTQKVTLYMHESSKSNVAGLSDKAQRLYLHILYSLTNKQDWFYLNKQDYMNKNKVKSQTTVNAAIGELHRYAFVQPTPVKGYYWVNPHRFFPGNRLEKYPDNKVVVTTWDQRKDTEKKKPVNKKVGYKLNKGEKEQMEADYRKDREDGNRCNTDK